MTARRRRCTTAALALAVFLIPACADGGDSDDLGDSVDGPVIVTTTPGSPSSAPPSSAAPSTAAPNVTPPSPTQLSPTEPATTDPPPEPTTPALPVGPMGDPVVAFVEVARLDRPVDLSWRAGDPTLFVVEQPGRVVAVDPTGGPTRVVLDVTALTAAQGERGLLGLAFHPDGDRAFVNHTDLAGNTVVAEYRVGADGTFDPATRSTVIEIAQPFSNHNGGSVVIGPDGHLYVGTGDGGSGGDPQRLALDLTSPLGKLLRLDVATPGASATVPPDNPFVGVEGARPEIFAIGLRNPWRFSFDPATGDLWVADVGQNRLEEVNLIPAPDDGSVAGRAASFGWSAFEATDRFNADQPAEGHVAPVLVYQHGDDCSVSGGAVYRGTAIPALVSGYVYGDYCSGRVWALDLAGGRNLLLGTVGPVTAVLPGPDRELYVLTHGGPVHRISLAG